MWKSPGSYVSWWCFQNKKNSKKQLCLVSPADICTFHWGFFFVNPALQMRAASTAYHVHIWSQCTVWPVGTVIQHVSAYSAFLRTSCFSFSHLSVELLRQPVGLVLHCSRSPLVRLRSSNHFWQHCPWNPCKFFLDSWLRQRRHPC